MFASVGGTTLAEYHENYQTPLTWTKSYTYLGSSQLATITPNGTGGEYIEFNHPDRLGTRLQTNQSGGTAYEQTTLPFGTALNAESTVQNNNKRFTSYDRSNATGLDYAVNRTYDSKQGRFTQVDPIGMSAVSLASPQTLNLYAYCGNDPINYTDAMGLFFGSLFKWIIKILKLIAAAVLVFFAYVSFASGNVIGGIEAVLQAAQLVADVFNLKKLQRIIAIASIAVSVIRIRTGNASATPPIFSYQSEEGTRGIDPGYLSIFASIGAIASSFSGNDKNKKRSKKRSQWPCPLRWVLSGGIFNRGKKPLNDVLDSAWNDSTTGNERGKEQGGWVYMNKNKNVKAVRKVRDANDGAVYINLGRPPAMAGWRVIGTFHTHSEGFPNPSVTVPGFVTGDIDVNYNQQVPGLIVGMNQHGERINTPYGPSSGYFGTGIPSGCR